MSKDESKSSQSSSEQIFAQIEETMEPGGVRDLWLNLRNELSEGGPEAVRTYLESEYQRRKTIVQDALDELTDQVEGTS